MDGSRGCSHDPGHLPRVYPDRRPSRPFRSSALPVIRRGRNQVPRRQDRRRDRDASGGENTGAGSRVKGKKTGFRVQGQGYREEKKDRGAIPRSFSFFFFSVLSEPFTLSPLPRTLDPVAWTLSSVPEEGGGELRCPSLELLEFLLAGLALDAVRRNGPRHQALD